MTENETQPTPAEPSTDSTEPVTPVGPVADAEAVGTAESPVPAVLAVPPLPPVPAGPAGSTETVESPVPARHPARRRRVAALLGALLLAAGVIGGVGYTVVTVDGADRDPGAPLWTFPKATPESAKPAAQKGLAGMLVPYGTDSWSRGPDIGEYGYDAQLSGARATALRKESLSGLPRTQRRALEKQIDKQRLQGVAMRSYLSSVYGEKASAVTIELSELANASAVRELSRYQEELVDVLGDFLRKGPAVKGHKDARCFLAPEDKKEKLDSMVCFAHQGNVLVSLTASSPKRMDQKGVAMLLREQLDRIAEPGEAV
ncbi:hypothetical protein ACFY3E_27765 [Streptomyces griseorubiginosus]|uniref:hypothetical protein n=1 Tax=Streptomyces griseorubiginosus TaxID=67304 RepID=UPI0036788138